MTYFVFYVSCSRSVRLFRGLEVAGDVNCAVRHVHMKITFYMMDKAFYITHLNQLLPRRIAPRHLSPPGFLGRLLLARHHLHHRCLI